MAKKKCTRFGRSKSGKRVCKKFSGTKKGATKKKTGARKGRCLKWSKGRTRCMRRAK